MSVLANIERVSHTTSGHIDEFDFFDDTAALDVDLVGAGVGINEERNVLGFCGFDADGTWIVTVDIGQHNGAAGSGAAATQAEVELHELGLADGAEVGDVVSGCFGGADSHRVEVDHIAVAVVIDADIAVVGAEGSLDVAGHGITFVVEHHLDGWLVAVEHNVASVAAFNVVMVDDQKRGGGCHGLS